MSHYDFDGKLTAHYLIHQSTAFTSHLIGNGKFF